MDQKFCPNCGKPAKLDAAFCGQCGKPFAPMKPVSAAPAAETQPAVPVNNGAPTSQAVQTAQTTPEYISPYSAPHPENSGYTAPIPPNNAGYENAYVKNSGDGGKKSSNKGENGGGGKKKGLKIALIIIGSVVLFLLLLVAVGLILLNTVFKDRVEVTFSWPWEQTKETEDPTKPIVIVPTEKETSDETVKETEKKTEAATEKETSEEAETEKETEEETEKATEKSTEETIEETSEETIEETQATATAEEQLAGVWQGILNTVIVLNEDGKGFYIEPASADASLKKGVEITWDHKNGKVTVYGLSYDIYADWTEGNDWFTMCADNSGWNPETFEKTKMTKDEAVSRKMNSLTELAGVTTSDANILVNEILKPTVNELMKGSNLNVLNKDGSSSTYQTSSIRSYNIVFNNEAYYVKRSKQGSMYFIFPVRIDMTSNGGTTSVYTLVSLKDMKTDMSYDSVYCTQVYSNINNCIETELSGFAMQATIEKISLSFGEWIQ